MIKESKVSKISHCAFSDEASYNIGRFRAIGMLSLSVSSLEEYEREVQKILKESNIREFKWKKLKSARMYYGAIKLIDHFIESAKRGISRIDVLVWDIEDKRHKIKRRDDCGNLARMYYHLFKNVLVMRWPSNLTWKLFPDENSSIDWKTVKDCLRSKEIVVSEKKGLFRDFAIDIRREFNIKDLNEVKSSTTPLVGVTDLFAGMGVYSHLNFDKYQKWEYLNSEQGCIFPEFIKVKFSRSDEYRCPVIEYLYTQCRDQKLGVSLIERRGLWTPQPKNPINFWNYKPQSDMDTAPTREN